MWEPRTQWWSLPTGYPLVEGGELVWLLSYTIYSLSELFHLRNLRYQVTIKKKPPTWPPGEVCVEPWVVWSCLPSVSPHSKQCPEWEVPVDRQLVTATEIYVLQSEARYLWLRLSLSVKYSPDLTLNQSWRWGEWKPADDQIWSRPHISLQPPRRATESSCPTHHHNLARTLMGQLVLASHRKKCQQSSLHTLTQLHALHPTVPTQVLSYVTTKPKDYCSIRICQMSNNIQTKPPNWNENKSMMWVRL